MRTIPATARNSACPGLVPTCAQQSAFCGTRLYSGGLQGGVQEAEGGAGGGEEEEVLQSRGAGRGAAWL